MNRVKKIFGPPGTGKTTFLLNLVEQALLAKVQPERVAYMAFTRRAAEEAQRRAMERFQLPKDRLPHFRTLHSMAFRTLQARRDDIMQDNHFDGLGKALGFQFSNLDEEFPFVPPGTNLGDRVRAIESLARVRQVSLQAQWEKSNYRDVPWLAVEQWAQALSRFKDSHGLMDYADLLEQFDEELDIDLFIVDESQDLSRLQWGVVRKAATRAKRIYCAGDDDQCIYGWAGADVDYFLNLQGDSEILQQSFRVPARVQQLANTVAARIKRRQPKTWRPRQEQGDVRYLRYETGLDLSQGSWMLLARNRSELKRYVEMLDSSGYPYLKEGRHSTNTPQTRAILAWEHWRKGNPLKPADVLLISKQLPQLEKFRPRESVFLQDAPLTPEVKKQSWMEALQVEPRRREYLRACLSNRESLIDKPRITVSTIHRVKGGEADHVVLIPDLSANPYRQRQEDEEQRVLYVALTRARETLTIIQPQTQMAYQI